LWQDDFFQNGMIEKVLLSHSHTHQFCFWNHISVLQKPYLIWFSPSNPHLQNFRLATIAARLTLTPSAKSASCLPTIPLACHLDFTKIEILLFRSEEDATRVHLKTGFGVRETDKNKHKLRNFCKCLIIVLCAFTFISFVSLHWVNNYTSWVSLGKNWVALFFSPIR
jgi:hypothetical protein